METVLINFTCIVYNFTCIVDYCAESGKLENRPAILLTASSKSLVMCFLGYPLGVACCDFYGGCPRKGMPNQSPKLTRESETG